ncbi:uncharacterized protein TA14915 [Theileria annulata]|uniref:Uncharacterized protein n=1 Tax=Theileria annulata TaxID=5874 RepID=Q4UFA5_THEAN|nr:uncharacterized protein TA14915 [Theileria annulata]CAI74234.1 hypothetical protein TA14915 [Theileria annulata]|eukprot:XP_951966.1 hypothetical protein TA14915 [Theileria annulata]
MRLNVFNSKLRSISVFKNLLKLNSKNNNYVKNNYTFKFKKGYMYNKYFGKNPEQTQAYINEKVKNLIGSDVKMLDSCKTLLNFNLNYKFVQLIEANIHFYTNNNNLYYLLKYLLIYQTTPDPGNIVDNYETIMTVIDKICYNFDEINNKFEILGLLCDFEIVHGDFTHLVHNFIADPANIKVLENNIYNVLRYFNLCNKVSCNDYTDTIINTLIANGSHRTYKIRELLIIFKSLLDYGYFSNLSCVDYFNFVLSSIGSRFNSRDSFEFVKFFEILAPYSYYPYLNCLDFLDNEKILQEFSNNTHLIDTRNLINICSIYLCYLKNHETLSKFINLSLVQIFNHYNGVIHNLSLFQVVDRENSLPGSSIRCVSEPTTQSSVDLDVECLSGDELLKLTRRMCKFFYDCKELLDHLTYPNLLEINRFLSNYESTVHFLSTPYDKLSDSYTLFGKHKPIKNKDKVLLLDDMVGNYVLMRNKERGVGPNDVNGMSKLHTEVKNVLSGLNFHNLSNEVTIGPYKTDILIC